MKYSIAMICSLLFLTSCDSGNLPADNGAQGARDEAGSQQPPSGGESAQRPNFLVIMADDLGYTDIGLYGSEIRTPSIDALASHSRRFTQFYAAPTCSPSRSMLMTGLDSHFTGFGNMAEHLAENQRGHPGYEGYMNYRIATLPEVLQDAGYRTYMAGKWHIGSQEGMRPHERGFDRSVALMQGGAGHLNLDRMLGSFPETLIYEDGVKLESVPEDFYSSEFYADKIIDYIDSGLDNDQPFFAWLAFTAVHWPLQVREEHLDLYAGQYDDGYEALREQRLQGAINAGLVPADLLDVPRLPRVKPWDQLSAEEQRYSSRIMEIYAAMVERMDYHTGRVLQHLKDLGQYDNTVVVFMSDNGAEGHDRLQLLDNATWVPANHDLSYENLGRVNSYTFLGPGWGQASTAPLRLFKAYTTEGGLRVPFLLKPASAEEAPQWIESVALIQDLMPTFMELAGIEDFGSEFNGREVFPITGRSMVPLLAGEAERLYDEDDVLGWELFGHRAIRKGDWKILWADGKNGSDDWQLFNLAEDPREVVDLADEYPDKLAELIQEWDAYAIANNVILPIGDIGNPN